MTRRPEFDVDRARGEKAEELYRRLRTAILVGAAEVKRDDRAAETGRFYIERECRRIDGWQPSGIDDPDSKASAWVLVAWPVVLAMPTWILKLAIEGAKSAECTVGSHPTRGVVIELGELHRRAVAVANAPVPERPAA